MIELIRIQTNGPPRPCTYKIDCDRPAIYRTPPLPLRVGETHTIACCVDCAELFREDEIKKEKKNDYSNNTGKARLS